MTEKEENFEYRVCYTVNDKGYSKEKPWLDYFGESESEAGNALGILKQELKQDYLKYEAWIESRKVEEWTRLD